MLLLNWMIATVAVFVELRLNLNDVGSSLRWFYEIVTSFSDEVRAVVLSSWPCSWVFHRISERVGSIVCLRLWIWMLRSHYVTSSSCSWGCRVTHRSLCRWLSCLLLDISIFEDLSVLLYFVTLMHGLVVSYMDCSSVTGDRLSNKVVLNTLNWWSILNLISACCLRINLDIT